jgi:hypothetical protein
VVQEEVVKASVFKAHLIDYLPRFALMILRSFFAKILLGSHRKGQWYSSRLEPCRAFPV